MIATQREIGLVSVRLAGAILDRIRGGEFSIGSRLPSEMDLSEAFGVSRPSVREALSALQFAGYVESRKGYGTVVIVPRHHSGAPQGAAYTHQPISLANALDLLEARLTVEPAAVQLAATKPDADGVMEARTLLDGMWLALESPDLVGAETDLHFHAAIIKLCPNRILQAIALSLLEQAHTAAVIAIRRAAWANAEVLQEWAIQHEAMLSGIQAGDGRRAARALRAHLLSVVGHMSRARGISIAERRRLKSMLVVERSHGESLV